MQTLKDVVKAPSRMTPYGRAYYLKPIVSYHSDDAAKIGSKIEFENPRVIYKAAREWYQSVLYFNYSHPNRNTISFEYRGDLYGQLCLGSLITQMTAESIVSNPKYPIILYNFLSTYNNSGYWQYSERNYVCALCKGKCVYKDYHDQRIKMGDKWICLKCQRYIVDSDGYSVDISEIPKKDPKITWDNTKKKFVYKGKLR
jgi:hypothetical protein